jgi:hypothetical protein
MQFVRMSQPPKTFCHPQLFQSGMGAVVIARFKSGGRVEAGVFLLDLYCLGVKNAFFHQCHEDEFAEFLADMLRGAGGGPPEEHSGAWGRKLVEGAADYARRLGFSPHRDYKIGARVMGGIDPKQCSETFAYGFNGKPLFIAGPNDGEERCSQIMRILAKSKEP